MKIKQLLNIIKLLKNTKNYIISTISQDNNINHIYSDNLTEDEQAQIFNNIKENLISKLGNEKYGLKLEQYDNDLFNAYKELDYLTAKADYYQSLYEYNKTLNDPNSGDANYLYILYKRVFLNQDQYQKYNEL